MERAIARIAGRQDNVITREQLLDAGLTRGAIAHRVRSGRWRQQHRGVYLLGPAPPTPMAKARAATMACGDGAVVSHLSAARLFGLLPPGADDVEITVAGRNPGNHPGIRLHRVKTIPKQDVTKANGIKITSIARTICDLAATESPRDTEQAFQEALYREIVTDKALMAVLAREPCRRGAPVIRALLDNPSLTRSERERQLLKLIEQAGLPKPLTNVPINGYKADVFWPQHNLILEFDGWQAHGHRHAFESNRKRDQIMLANGLSTLRVTDRQLTNEPIALVARIAQALR